MFNNNSQFKKVNSFIKNIPRKLITRHNMQPQHLHDGKYFKKFIQDPKEDSVPKSTENRIRIRKNHSGIRIHIKKYRVLTPVHLSIESSTRVTEEGDRRSRSKNTTLIDIEHLPKGPTHFVFCRLYPSSPRAITADYTKINKKVFFQFPLPYWRNHDSFELSNN